MSSANFKSLIPFMPDFQGKRVLEIGSSSQSGEYENVLKEFGVALQTRLDSTQLSTNLQSLE